MPEDFKEQLKKYLSEELDIVLSSRYNIGSNEEIFKVSLLLEGETITSDTFDIYQNYE